MNQINITHRELRHLFGSSYLQHVMHAISVGNSPATILADDLTAPASAFIWDQAHCLYFGGEPDHDAFLRQLQQYLTQVVLPDARNRQLGLLKLYRAHSGWDAFLDSAFAPVELREGQRVLYIRHPETKIPCPLPLPDGFRLARIDEAVLNQESGGVRELIGEIESCWPTVAKFLNTGFGYCALHADDGVVCWCTAEYVSSEMCGVGIETIESYQGLGLATATAQAFMQHATDQNMTVYWDSWQGNLPSIRVAEKLGLERIDDYSVRLMIIK